MEAGPHIESNARFEEFFPGTALEFLRTLGAWTVPFALVDESDVILFWNRGAAKLYGLGEDAVLGRIWCEVVGETSAAPQATPQGVRTLRYEARHRSSTGDEIPVMVTRTEMPGRQALGGAFILVTDLTDSKVLERGLARRVAQLSVIREISECLQSAMGLDRILRTILVGATASQGLRFNRAFLLLASERRGRLEGRDAIGPADPGEAEMIWSRLAAHDRTLRDLVDEYEPITAGAETGVQHIAAGLSVSLADAESFLVRAFRADDTTHVEGGVVRTGADAPLGDLVEALGVDTFVAVPLQVLGKPVGLLIADNAITKRAITDEDVDMLELLGFQAGHAIERARLTDELARKLASLEELAAELRKKQDALVQAERLSAIGEMAARVAHEIRNPLVAIGGFARSLLQRREQPDETTREALEIIADEVRRLESIVREVLDFSRPVPPRIGSVSITRLAAEALELLRFEFDQAGISAALEAPGHLARAAADRDQLFQALVNVLRNAIDAMPQGGKLRVRLSGLQYGIEMAVVDSGVGMSPEVLARVLEPFYTTKTNGSGLGLTIAAQIVRDHHGDLKLESREGEGTTVTFRLPAVTEESDAQDSGD